MLALTASAKEPAVRLTEDNITLLKTQTTFEASIEIAPQDAYAGVEIGVACPKGVSVTGASASLGSMTASPVLSNGLYWTSFFEAANKLSGTMKITLRLSCPQGFEEGVLTLEQVKVYTKEGAAVATEKLTPSLKTRVRRLGSGSAGTDDPGGQSSGTQGTNPPNGGQTSGTGGTEGGSDEDASSGAGAPSATADNSGSLIFWLSLSFAAAAGVTGAALLLKKKKGFSLR